MATPNGSFTPAERASGDTLITDAAPTLLVAATSTRSFTPVTRKDTLEGVSLAAAFGIPFLDFSAFDKRRCPEQLIDSKLLRKYQVLPLHRRANRLILAVADPANIAGLNDIKFHTGLVLDLVVVSAAQLRVAIEEFSQAQESLQPLLQDWHDEQLENIQIEAVAAAATTEADESAIDETPIVRFVNKLILEAVTNNTSDIHIEPYERYYRIRFRVDGILREVARPPIRFASRIAARIKVMAQLNISEKRLPQDGRIKLRITSSRSIDLRVNFLPTLWGEKVVLRLLEQSSVRLGIDALGMDANQKSLYLAALHKSQGCILVTGPTGSGKSVTLYTGLNILNSTERNIATAEDPVEMHIAGLNQVNINTKSGFDFAAALRAFLRQDPDVIMIGEIRDLETADTAIKAAQTGHLVLSTLHTNTAADAISRLLQMGIESYNIVASLRLIIAQRLARRLCDHCKESQPVSEKVLIEAGFREEQLAGTRLFRARGCKDCKQGYRGRIGIYEVVPITESLSRSIMSGASSSELQQQARHEGCGSLRDAALAQAARGLISLDEANRLT